MRQLSVLETEAIEVKLPKFKQMIDQAVMQRCDCITTLSLLPDNPMLLYMALQYAADRSVAILLLPKEEFDRQANL